MGHAGQRFEFLDGVLEKQTLSLDIGIRTGRQSHEKCGDPFRAETGIDILQAAKTIDQQDGADEQHEGERDLGDEQPGAQTAGLPARCAARRIFQRVDRIAPRSVQRRNEPEHQASQERKTHGEAEHGQVERDFEHARDKVFRDFLEQIEPPDREEHAENSGDSSGQHALGQKLDNDTAAGGAERGSNGDFLATRGEAREEKIGHVRAGDEQAHIRPRRKASGASAAAGRPDLHERRRRSCRLSNPPFQGSRPGSAGRSREVAPPPGRGSRLVSCAQGW